MHASLRHGACAPHRDPRKKNRPGSAMGSAPARIDRAARDSDVQSSALRPTRAQHSIGAAHFNGQGQSTASDVQCIDRVHAARANLFYWKTTRVGQALRWCCDSESNLRAPPDRCACVSEHVGQREPLQLRSSPSRWKGRTLLRQGDPAHRGARHSTQSAACARKEECRNRNGSQWHGERSQPISVRTWQAAAPSFSRLAWHANLTIGGGPHMRMSAAERGAQPTATVEPTTSHMQQP